ncbi:uncharacterized protein RJT20DRAFT_149392 [Scheffersomyces xylosifermentans]|uniref:uncharacterized protein n=1 Tax=Scheffersomyces xylosifermentans TaxID=1304137 RepID=UPI00315D912F
MSIWQQLNTWIADQDIASLSPFESSLTHNQFIRNWNRKSPNQKKFLILELSLLASISYYVLSPSLPWNKDKMFSKRPDKYTTGLINLRNDCFANSSIQAYSSLPGLTDYLNKFIVSFQQFSGFVKDHNINIEEIIKERMSKNKAAENSSSKFKNSNSKFDIPLHIALAEILKKLQETQMTSRTISVWTFLHVVEEIFHAKISRSQHDAQELTQLINETLENENLKIRGLFKHVRTNLHLMLGSSSVGPEHYTLLDKIQVPDFPFSGLTLSQLKCLKCQGVSTPNFAPFLMVTLNTPEKSFTDIETLIGESENETIEGYQCLRCCINTVVENEAYMKRNVSEDEEKFLKEVRKFHTDPNLCINDDFPKELDEYIRKYNKGGVDVSKVTSTIFGLHLSRSSFDGVNATRNSCRVSFKEHLTLSIGKEYHEKLLQFQAQAEAEEDEKLEDKVLTTKVLTTDVNDMEDEEVQRGDFDVKGSEVEDNDEDVGNTTENATSADEKEAEDANDSDSSSTSTEESLQPSVSTAPTLQNSSSTQKSTSATPQTINNAPISDAQTDHLKEHFKKFKFNENDIYKYRLKAMIRHQGSHTQGHYECYKKKPLYVKDKEGNIFKLFPEVIDNLTGDITYDVTTEEPLSPIAENSGSTTGTPVSRKNLPQSMHSNPSNNLDTAANGEKMGRTDSVGSTGSNDSNLRRKLSTMMGRRPSVFQADPEQADIEEIVRSGSATPAELLVHDLEPGADYFSPELASSALRKSLSTKSHHDRGSHTNGNDHSDRVKMKKISSAIKYPYWRISDSTISEVSRASVLSETSSVYMLYYERVDRKQINPRSF